MNLQSPPSKTMKPQFNSTQGTTAISTSNRYLKPGALARIRNSKISARSHTLMLRRLNSLLSSFSSPPPLTQTAQISGSQIETSLSQVQSPVAHIESVGRQLPDFPALINSPRCLRRKKLVAAKSYVFSVDVSGSGSGRGIGSGHVVSESSPGSPFASAVNSDLLVR